MYSDDDDIERRRMLARAVPLDSPGDVNSSPNYRSLINANPSPVYQNPPMANPGRIPEVPRAKMVLDFTVNDPDDQVAVVDPRYVSNSTGEEELIFAEVGGGDENSRQPDAKKPTLTKQSSLQDVKKIYKTVTQFSTFFKDSTKEDRFYEEMQKIMPRSSVYELARYTFDVSRFVDRKDVDPRVGNIGQSGTPAYQSVLFFYANVRAEFLGSGEIGSEFTWTRVDPGHSYLIHDGPVFSYIRREPVYTVHFFDFEKYGPPKQQRKQLDSVTYMRKNGITNGCYYVTHEKNVSTKDKGFITAALEESFGDTDKQSFLVTKKSYNAHEGNSAMLLFSNEKTRFISAVRKKGTSFEARLLKNFRADKPDFAARVDFDLTDKNASLDQGALYPFFLAEKYKLSVSAEKPYTLTCAMFKEEETSTIDINIESITKDNGLDGSRIHAITTIGNIAIIATSNLERQVYLIACDTVNVDATQPDYMPPRVHKTFIVLDDPVDSEIPLVQMFISAHVLCISTHGSLYYLDVMGSKKSRGKPMPAIKPKAAAAAEDTLFTELTEKNHMNSVKTIVSQEGPTQGSSRDETVSLIFAIAEAKRAAALKTSVTLKYWRILETDFFKGLSLLFAVNGLKFDKKKEEKTDLVVSVRNNGEHVVSTGYDEGNQKFVHRVIEKIRAARYSTFIFTDPQSEYKCLVRSPTTTSASKLRETFTNNAAAEIVKIRTEGNPSLGLPTLMRDGDSDDLVHAVVFMPNEETDDIQLVVEIVSADSRQKAVCLLLRQEKSGAATVLTSAVRETSNIARGDIGVDYNVQRMAYRTVDASGQSEELRVKSLDSNSNDVLYDLADNSRILFSMSDVLLVAARLDHPFNVGYWQGASSSKNRSNLFSGDEYATKKLLAIAHYGFTAAAIFRQGSDYFLGAGDLLGAQKATLVKLDKFKVKDDDYSDRALLSFGARRIVAVVGKGPAWEIDVMKAVFPPPPPLPPPQAPPEEAVPTTAAARKRAQQNDDIVSKTSVNFIQGAAIRDFEVKIAADDSAIDVNLPDEPSAVMFASKNAILVTDVSEYDEFLKSFEFELDRAAGERIVATAAYSIYNGEDVEDDEEDDEGDDEGDDDKDDESLSDVDVKFREPEGIDASLLDGVLEAKNVEEKEVKELEEKLEKSTKEEGYSDIMNQIKVVRSELFAVSASRQRALDAAGLILDNNAKVTEKGYKNVESEDFKKLDIRKKELEEKMNKLSGMLEESKPYIQSELVARKKSLANITIAYTKIKHLFDVREQLYEIYDRLPENLFRENVLKKISELEEEIYLPEEEREFRNVSANLIGSDSQGATIEVFREQQKQTVSFLTRIYYKRNEVISGIDKNRLNLNNAISDPRKYPKEYAKELKDSIENSRRVLAEVNGQLEKKLDGKSNYRSVLRRVFDAERNWLAAHPNSEITNVGDDDVVAELNTILVEFNIPQLDRKINRRFF